MKCDGSKVESSGLVLSWVLNRVQVRLSFCKTLFPIIKSLGKEVKLAVRHKCLLTFIGYICVLNSQVKQTNPDLPKLKLLQEQYYQRTVHFKE